MGLAQQIDLLIKLLNYEVSVIETKVLSRQTYERCLMQKAFLSFLANMTADEAPSSRDQGWQKTEDHSYFGTQRASEMTFRISRNSKECSVDRLYSKKGSNDESCLPKGILKMSAEKAPSPQKRSQSSPNSNSGKARSPARKLIRLLEKENSPVRQFLDSDNSKQLSSIALHEVGPSSMFEKLTAQTDEGRRIVLKERQDNGQREQQRHLDFALKLKCMRLWKVYTHEEKEQRRLEKDQKR